MSDNKNGICPKCSGKINNNTQFCPLCAFDLSETSFSTVENNLLSASSSELQTAPFLQHTESTSSAPTFTSTGSSTIDFGAFEIAGSKATSTKGTEIEIFSTKFDDRGIPKKKKEMMFGIGVGIVFLLIGGYTIVSSDSRKEKLDSGLSTSEYSNSNYGKNSYSYNPTDSTANTHLMNTNYVTEQQDDNIVPNANYSSVSPAEKIGQLITDSHLRDAPNKDAYSLGIHFKDAKVEILDETSYEREGSVSTWYKVRVTDYGCSKDPSLGCGKNTPNDADEGWMNAKSVLIVGGGNTQPQNQRATINSNYSVRIYNVDDHAAIYINGSKAAEADYYTTESRDITNWLRPGVNELRFVLQNFQQGYTYGFEVYQNNKSIFKDECGVVGRSWCGRNFQTGVVYERTINVNFP